MENQTNKGYNKKTSPKFSFGKSSKAAGFTGNGISVLPGFETISGYD
jgi:hypothetical protein